METQGGRNATIVDSMMEADPDEFLTGVSLCFFVPDS